jgi:DNA polymerase III delta prime subunit
MSKDEFEKENLQDLSDDLFAPETIFDTKSTVKLTGFLDLKSSSTVQVSPLKRAKDVNEIGRKKQKADFELSDDDLLVSQMTLEKSNKLDFIDSDEEFELLTRQEPVVPNNHKDYTKLPATNNFIRGKSCTGNLYFPKKQKGKMQGASLPKNILSENISKLMSQVMEDVKFDTVTEGLLTEKYLTKDQSLWVDKYKPKKYVDLVGDEQVNRSVLNWIKEWDYCVFKKKNRMPRVAIDDKYQRPYNRILILAGPPGLGKTTLAHIVAKHSGYNIIEINASDERTSAVFKYKVVPAITTKSLMGNKKPNCIIIDEIDGALSTGTSDQGFIKSLVNLVKPSAHPLKKGKKKKLIELQRPIICICNDPFVPSLKPLREVAKVVHFKIPEFNIIADRLTNICKWEDVSTDLKTMITLCEATQGDLRSSINALQFLQQKSQAQMNENIKSLKVGSKDISQGWHHTCEVIFRKGAPSKNSKVKKAKADELPYINSLCELISSFGDQDLIIQGIFQIYLSML